MNEQPIDPDVSALLTRLGPSKPVAEVSADEMRDGMRTAVAVFTADAARIDVHQVEDTLVDGRDGQIPVRVYSPEQPLAVVEYLHGGSWMAGGIDTHDHVTRRLCRDTGAVVVSVDYRLLPEHPFPAPVDDAYDAALWAARLHPDLPFLVAGDSAGGTLAACTALRARDLGGPAIDGQVLVYPGIDDDADAPSMTAFAGLAMTREDLRHVIEQYAATAAARDSSYALPARAASMAGLPPTVLAIPGYDLLRSSEEAYAERLRDAGVPVTVQLDHELAHAWIEFAPLVPAADRAFVRLCDAITGLITQAAAPARPS